MTSRRDFLKSILACGGAICLPLIVPRCGSSLSPISGPRDVLNDRRASIAKRAKANRQKVWAWLRMSGVNEGGICDVPSSEAAYKANLDKIDVAMPLNGGKLQSDGTWLQEEWKINPDWPQSLPRLARSAGHLYMPGVGNDRTSILDVLNAPSLQAIAVSNLVILAESGRFDSPWDGVYLDLEGIPSAFRQQLSDFLYLLSDRIKQAGLLLGVSLVGRTSDTGQDADDHYAYDFSVVGKVADYVDLRCYENCCSPPMSISPYWWMEACIQYALSKGIDRKKMTLGLGNFSKYWPDSTSNLAYEVTYDCAKQLVNRAGSTIEWIERNENGFVREWFAPVTNGHIWIHDGTTYQQGLNLIDQYCLLGNTVFVAGMGDELQWQAIKAGRMMICLPIGPK